ncbi:MAG TPA: TfoX/Sxy family protein [Solirubrobacteraceae bacterium]|nr:TfoX/Sxy family protein [Solirubrobacteraceae bacterium]
MRFATSQISGAARRHEERGVETEASSRRHPDAIHSHAGSASLVTPGAVARGRQTRAAQRDNPRMAYDEDLATRIRELLVTEPGVKEQAMFGGLAFLIGGHMSVSASGQGGLLLRVDPEETDALVEEPHAEPFVMRGRAMQGWLRVDADGVRTQPELERWVARGVAFAQSLPPKP